VLNLITIIDMGSMHNAEPDSCTDAFGGGRGSANLGCPEACLAKGVDIRIADSKGDWGYPNPYRHYPRGPGYVRMSWVFDTLLWKDNGGYVPALASKWSYDPGQDAVQLSAQSQGQMARWPAAYRR
jgi:hypothetical protein